MIIFILAVVFVIAFMCMWSVSLSKNRIESNAIIAQFEMDGMIPVLTEMIDFHQRNGIVEYEI